MVRFPQSLIYCSPASVVGTPPQDLAYGLQLLTVLVVGGQQEAPVPARPLPPAQVGADHHEVQGVTHAIQVVLLQLWRGARDEGDPGTLKAGGSSVG